MNYFELFGIPVSLKVDKAGLGKKYIELQKQYHPDYFGNASEAEKHESLDISSQVNKAWKTFQSEDATIKYVLQIKGLLEEEEKYQLPNHFLMAVMELNELKMDGAEPEEIAGKTISLQNEIYNDVQDTISQYNENITPTTDLLRVKEYYYKKKYLDRLLESS